MKDNVRWVEQTVTVTVQTGNLCCEACGSVKGAPHYCVCAVPGVGRKRVCGCGVRPCYYPNGRRKK